MPSPQIQFRALPELATELITRTRPDAELSHTAREQLERYFQLLQRERETIAGLFTVNELLLVMDAFQGTLVEPHMMHLVAMEMADALVNEDEALADKWRVNGESLLHRLRQLSVGQSWALLDAVERWHRLTAEQKRARHRSLLSVGLVPGEGRDG